MNKKETMGRRELAKVESLADSDEEHSPDEICQMADRFERAVQEEPEDMDRDTEVALILQDYVETLGYVHDLDSEQIIQMLITLATRIAVERKVAILPELKVHAICRM